MHHPSRHTLGGVDVSIDHPAAALAILDHVVHRPLRDETVLVLLDAYRRCLGVITVVDTTRPDAILEVAELAARLVDQHDRLDAVVLATVRPACPPPPEMTDGRSDLDRWLEASDLLDDAGVELIEWYVVDPLCRASCPRDLLGEPPRW